MARVPHLITHFFARRRSQIVICTNFRCISNTRSLQKPEATLQSDDTEYRQRIAPWLKFGEYQKGLLSHLSTPEIIRALFVLQLCSFDTFVDKSTQLFNLSKKLGGRLSEFLVRKTFFEQFVGGDQIDRMRQTVDLLHERGITLMSVPVLEEDVEDEKSCKDVYDENLKALKNIAEMTSLLDKQKPCLLLKMSAIVPAKTMEVVNARLTESWKSPEKLARLVDDFYEKKDKSEWSGVAGISKEDREHYLNGIRRADNFIELARDLGVKILVDAEFYTCKLAISTISMLLIRKYNEHDYVVGDTVQAYLKEGFDTLQTEWELVTKIFGINWYGKVVRGAYMDRERYLAAKKGVPSPICDTYEDTSNSYNKCVNYVLHMLKEGTSKKSHLLIASHNEKSIRIAVDSMKKLNILPEDDIVSFGQTYGMADYLSTPLVKSNYKVYKSTPYGPIEKVVPYLARRASENRSVLKGAREERSMLKKELLSRLF